ncbi:galactose-specific lectin nattectin-like [Dunckerocampus dactyliophorus]|uniref:galactose-specific lectin nattectin-like n=1 Tax=Dunckerocampus dactyliophorus TaxID=161453 RepID=UPI00240621AE|nr:galactose-specific lectin nattectin-like [Dunckerocampus dactyliophorus]
MAFAPRLLFLLCGISGLLAGSCPFPLKTGRCPVGWTQLDDRCFIFQNVDVNFATAETICNILGGNLASIHSNLENEVIRQLIFEGTGFTRHTWIGFSDSIQEGNYIWTDGSQVDFTDWETGRPNNNGNQDCAVVNFNNVDNWNDIRCRQIRPLICARDLKYHN